MGIKFYFEGERSVGVELVFLRKKVLIKVRVIELEVDWIECIKI
jgi:hypothetical protein